MSSLEWRREQPRAEPPISDAGITLMVLWAFDALVWAGAFIVNGEGQALLWTLVFGFMAARSR